MESLIADFVQSFSTITFLFMEGRMSTMSPLSFEIVLKFSNFLRLSVLSCLTTHEATRTFRLW